MYSERPGDKAIIVEPVLAHCHISCIDAESDTLVVIFIVFANILVSMHKYSHESQVLRC